MSEASVSNERVQAAFQKAQDIEKTIGRGYCQKINVRFFVDGYHLFLSSDTQAKDDYKIISNIIKKYNFSVELGVSAQPIIEAALERLQDATESIKKFFTEKYRREDSVNLLDYSKVWLDAFRVWDDEGARQRFLKSLDHADGILDSEFEIRLFAGKPVDNRQLRELLWHMSKKASPSDRKELQQQISNLEHGFYHCNSVKKEKKVYEDFLQGLVQQQNGQNNQLEWAHTKFYIDDKTEFKYNKKIGSIRLEEKGVDAKLIISILDSLGHDLDAMCLVSNDSDFYPVVERVREVKPDRPFFLGINGDLNKVARKLKEVFPEQARIPLTNNLKSLALRWRGQLPNDIWYKVDGIIEKIIDQIEEETLAKLEDQYWDEYYNKLYSGI